MERSIPRASDGAIRPARWVGSPPGCSPAKILIVEDNTFTRHEIISILGASNLTVEIIEASDGMEALGLLLDQEDVDLIITDLGMPRVDGLNLLPAVRGEERFAHIPVIIVASKTEIQGKLPTFERGAHDFLTQPFYPAELIARVRVMLELRTHMLALQQRSIIDALTGLYSQAYLWEALGREIKRGQRYGLNLSCLMIDVDDFKSINDTMGHLVGDDVLRTMGRLLRSTLREYNVTVRYGGDEFVVLMQSTADGARMVASRIREAVAVHRFFPQDRRPNPVHVTIGVACAPASSIDDPHVLVEAADRALYRAKRAGKDRVNVTEFLNSRGYQRSSDSLP
ncbi:MAG: diguanylate cyclase [Nitrospirota bacterium]